MGIAISDPTGTLASPRGVIQHKSRSENARRIIEMALANDCTCIVIGVALNTEGGDTESSRRARNLAAEIEENSSLPVVTWDEGGSTQAAKAYAIRMGISKNRRRGHLDDTAAAIILQSFLDSRRSNTE